MAKRAGCGSEGASDSPQLALIDRPSSIEPPPLELRNRKEKNRMHKLLLIFASLIAFTFL